MDLQGVARVCQRQLILVDVSRSLTAFRSAGSSLNLPPISPITGRHYHDLCLYTMFSRLSVSQICPHIDCIMQPAYQ